MLTEHIGNLTFSFVTPVSSNYCFNHMCILLIINYLSLPFILFIMRTTFSFYIVLSHLSRIQSFDSTFLLQKRRYLHDVSYPSEYYTVDTDSFVSHLSSSFSSIASFFPSLSTYPLAFNAGTSFLIFNKNSLYLDIFKFVCCNIKLDK